MKLIKIFLWVLGSVLIATIFFPDSGDYMTAFFILLGTGIFLLVLKVIDIFIERNKLIKDLAERVEELEKRFGIKSSGNDL